MPAPVSNSIPSVLAVAFVATAIGLFLRAAGRWRALARAYPHRGAPPAERVVYENGSLCGFGFRGLLSVGGDAAAIYLAPSFPPLRALLPALAVPWERLFPEPDARLIFAMKRFRLGSPEGPRLELFAAGRPYRLLERIRPAAPP